MSNGIRDPLALNEIKSQEEVEIIYIGRMIDIQK